jgi:hypothetical protein
MNSNWKGRSRFIFKDVPARKQIAVLIAGVVGISVPYVMLIIVIWHTSAVIS